MASLPIRYLLPAIEELEEALDWYAAKSSKAADHFIQNAQSAIREIRNSPRLWPIGKDHCRQAPVLNYPYRIIYHEVGGFVEIVAIAHTSRRPGYWRKRLKP